MKIKIISCFIIMTISLLCLPSIYGQSDQGDFSPYWSKWEYNVHGGWGYRIAKLSNDTPVDLREYANSLRSGYAASTGFARYIHRRFGPGLRYSILGSSAQIDNVSAYDYNTGQTYYGRMQERIAIQFVAPTFNFRTVDRSGKRQLSLFVGVGYVDYRNTTIIGGNQFKLWGGKYATTAGANFGLALKPNLTLMAGGAIVTAALNRVVITPKVGEKYTRILLEDNRESLNHIQATLGLHWHWSQR